MDLLVSYIIFAAGLLIWKTDAEVTLITESMGSFTCGEPETMTCTIDPYSDVLTWNKGNDIIPLASCSPLSCSANPSFTSDFSFTFNTVSGIFNMTVIKVKLSDNGTTFVCGDGLTSDTVLTNVEVVDDCSVDLNLKQLDSNMTELSVTTGCIGTTTDVTVSFWFQQVNDTTGKKHNTSDTLDMINKSSNDSVCTTDPDCGTDGFTQRIITLEVKEEDSGKLYRAGVDVECGNQHRTTRQFDKTFTLNFQSEGSNNCTRCYILMGVAFFIIFIVLLQMCVYGYAQCPFVLEKGHMKWFALEQFITLIPLIGFIPTVFVRLKRTVSDNRLGIHRRHLWILCAAFSPILWIFIKCFGLRKKWNICKVLCTTVVSAFLCVASLVLEIFMIIVCVEWCRLCYLPVIFALIVLLLRLMLFNILVLCYYANSGQLTEQLQILTDWKNFVIQIYKEYLPQAEDQDYKQCQLVFGIALWCLPIIGTLSCIYWGYRSRRICSVLSETVSPSLEETLQSVPGHNVRIHGDFSAQTPRPVRPIPRVTSTTSMTHIHKKVPPIGSY